MSAGYELLESLGPAHPSQVSVTVAEATDRERRGIPMAISGDPVPVADTIEREWLRNNPGQPSPFDPDDQALLALAALELQHRQLRSRPLRLGWIPVAGTAAVDRCAPIQAEADSADPCKREAGNDRRHCSAAHQQGSRRTTLLACMIALIGTVVFQAGLWLIGIAGGQGR